MTKVIIVQGVSNSGKSSSIRKFVEGLGIYMVPGDFKLALPYIKGGKTFRVGVMSAGDNVSVINAGFTFLIPLRCDFIVCATKSSGSTVAHVQSIISSQNFSSTVLNTTFATSATAQTRNTARTAAEIDQEIP